MWNARDITKITSKLVNVPLECNERAIYKQYLLGLRKTKRLLQNTTNANNLNSLTHAFNFVNATNIINNTEIGAKNIIMGNIVLDVSNIKEIHITTTNDKIIVELDKNRKNVNIIDSLNNIDTLIGTLSLLGKITNMN